MTTPTIEQVVREAWDRSFRNVIPAMSRETLREFDAFKKGYVAARADLEATIAEQAKQLEEMAEAIRVKDAALVRIAGDGQCPNYWWEIYARDALAIQPSPEILAARDQRVAEACARVLEADANALASEYGYEDMGSLSFGTGAHAEAKMGRYNELLELAEAIRAGNWREYL